MWNIVIVDDEEIIAKGLAKMIHQLSEQYCVVEVFNDSNAAYHFFQQEHEEIDLLITDICMPDLSGLELIDRARDLQPGLLCAILTGFSEFEYAKKAIDLGVMNYLLKPIDSLELTELMNRLRILKPKSQDDKIKLLPHSREILYIKEELENHYREFDFNKVSEHLRMSKGYLLRLFKQEMGVTLNDYLTNVRIEKAKELLMEPGAYKVYEISEMVGYTDYVYFSKLFKKIVGTTPKSYQKYAKP